MAFLKKKYIVNNEDHNYQETVLITGGNSGIGYEFIKLCLLEKYNVIFTVRSKEKGDSTIASLKEEYDVSHLSYMLLDLNDFDSINNFINKISNENIDIHHFYHNAGMYRIPFKMIDKYEINYLTNYFAPFYISEKLIPYFSSFPHKVHFNFIYSLTTYYYKHDVNLFNIDHQINKTNNYAQTKHAVIRMYHYFLNKYKDTNIYFTLTHPGATYTPLILKGYKKGKLFHSLAKLFMKMFFHTPYKAAYTYRAALRIYEENKYIAPRGLGEFSGYPKIKNIKKKYYKNEDIIISKTSELLKGML